MESNNPFEAPRDERGSTTAVPEHPRDGITDLTEKTGKGPVTWRTSFDGDRVWFAPNNGEATISMAHPEFAERGQLMFGMMKALMLKTEPRPRVFQLHPSAAELFRKWLQPVLPEYLKRTLKTRMRFSIFLGVLLLGLQFVLPPESVSVLAMIVGLGWIIVGALSFLRPHALLFALDAALWVTYAVSSGSRAVEEQSAWAAIFAVACLVFARTSFNLWKFYK